MWHQPDRSSDDSGLTHGTSGDKGAEEMSIWMNYLSWRKVLLIGKSAGRKHLESILSITICFTNKKKCTSQECCLKRQKQLTLWQSHPGMCVENWWISVQKALWLMEAEMMCAVLWNYTVSSSALRLTSASQGLWETSSEAPMAIQRISWCFQTSWNLNHPKPRMVSNRPRFWDYRTCHPSLFISSLVAFLRAAAELVPIDSPLSRPWGSKKNPKRDDRGDMFRLGCIYHHILIYIGENQWYSMMLCS